MEIYFSVCRLTHIQMLLPAETWRSNHEQSWDWHRWHHFLFLLDCGFLYYGTLNLWNEACLDGRCCSWVSVEKVFAETWHFHYSVYFQCCVYFNKHLMDSHEAMRNYIQTNEARAWFENNSHHLINHSSVIWAWRWKWNHRKAKPHCVFSSEPWNGSSWSMIDICKYAV